MTRADELLRENEELRERLRRLSAASRRINESLDFDKVFREVIENAGALTGAEYGVIATLDESGQPRDLYTTGLTPELWEQLQQQGLQHYAHFCGLAETFRIRDFSGYMRSTGNIQSLPRPAGPFLVVPILHGGEVVGNIFLAREEGAPEFTEQDEETLVMFASQAALVIANARRYQDERKARADLETLINTSPVGVVVLDVKTGGPVSYNREAVRMVEDLRTPNGAPGHLLDLLTIRRADGREFSLAPSHLADMMNKGGTIRAEEMVLEVPDGRSLTVLINGSPIFSDVGVVETYVVTMQDMTALEELERLRAEFLGMVSHELRTPLTSVRGAITSLLDDTSARHPAERSELYRIILEQSDRMQGLIADLLDVARIETGALSVLPEPTDLAMLVDEARNGFLSGGGRQSLEIELAPDLPWVIADRSRLVQVLGNLLTNAARHSSESSTIRVNAALIDDSVTVSVSDEGRGIPAERLPLLFRKFSRFESEEHGGDSGLGLAICRGIVEAHGGRIWAESDGPGLGARFTFTLPTAETAGFVSPGVSAPVVGRSRQRQTEERVRILAVDDDPQALRYVRDTLLSEGYEPIVTGDADDAMRLLETENPRLALLDMMLPGTDGMALMKDIAQVKQVPVIFVTAYGQDALVARAFDLGAADYVVKPFSPAELSARIRAALRRMESPQPRKPYRLNDLAIDYAQRQVTLAGEPVQLTAIEYRTLIELSANGGRVTTYEQLLRRVWGFEGHDGNMGAMRTVINTLRRRLGDEARDPVYIFTEPRVGYHMPRSQLREPDL